MRFYRLLLRLFPASFRAEYGDQMCAVFAARRREENTFALWIRAILDVFTNAVRVHADVLGQDLRWTFRVLRQSPGFAFTAVSVIALGTGANTAGFALLDHVLLRPLPYPQPEQLVRLFETDRTRKNRNFVTPANFVDWRAMNQSFSSMACYTDTSWIMTGDGNPVRLGGAGVDAEVFKMLGATPVAGRSFSPDDYRADAAAVAMVNHSLATTLFGEAAGALGHVLRLDGRSYTVIGVMPAEFAFPSPDTRVWLPLSSAPEAWASRTDNSYVAIARVRPGVSLQQASADLNVIARQLERAYPVENANLGVEVAAMRDLIAPQLRTLVLALFGAAFCVLLIACTNLANLLLARAMVRRQEMAVRIAIGAARERLLRQLLTESLVLAVIGGAFGLLLAAGATPFLARLAPTGLPMHAAPHIDMRVFAFAAVVTILTSIAFGVGPALRSFRHADVNALRSRSAAGSGTDRLRAALVLAEVAGTVILLVSAGLLLKAMWRVQAVDPGFRTEGVLTLRTQLPPKYADFAKRRQFYAKVLSQARALPGVTSAGYAAFLPMVFGGGILPVKASGSEQAVPAGMRYVTQDYFTSLGIPLLQGRDVSQQDTTGSPLVTVLSESLAKRLWPAQDPLGRQVRVDDFTWTVVGVVGDVAARGLERSSEPQVYFSADQQTIKTFYAPKDLVIRVSGDPMSLAPAVLKIIRDTDPEQVVSDVRPLADVVALQTAPRRDQLHLLGAFAGIALLLAAVGIHGLLSFAVTARTREIGIRMALGAGRGNVRNMFLRQGFVLGVAGVAIAMPLAYGAARGMTSLLFGVRPEDPLVYAAAAVLALVMTLAGSLRPGIRAASVDPAITIRVE